MRILNLSSDSAILNPQSKPAKRMVKYGSLVEKYFIIVFAVQDQFVRLSDNVTAQGVSGHRLSALVKMYNLAKKSVRAGEVDVITVQDPFELALIGWLLAKKYKVGLNIQEHGDFFSAKYWRNENIKNFLRYYLGLYLLPRADSIRAVSQRIKNNLIQKLKISADKIIVVPVYVELSHAGAGSIPSIADRLKDKIIILTMARLVKQKNLPLLIRSFGSVSAKSPKAVMVIVGRGPEKNKLVSLVEELKLKEKVIFIDWTDDIYSYYELADIYALSSNYEGWGMVIIEAASCGLPIAMTDVGCAGEVVKNNINSLIVPIGDQEQLAQALSKLIDDRELGQKLGAAARGVILCLPDQEQTLKLYQDSWLRARRK